MPSAEHIERQRLSREAKAARRASHESQAHKRITRQVEVDKGVLLEWLKMESIVPIAAKRIIATGHRPDVLTVVYTEEES